MAREDTMSPEERLDRFAELLSQEVPIRDAGTRLGITSTSANRLFRKICERLGPQAR